MSQPLEVSDPADGSVNWKAATEHMLGQADPDGESAGEGAADATQTREFKYRGKALKVDPETYEVLEGLRREARGENGRVGSELARAKERLAKLEGLLEAKTPDRHDEPEIKPPDPLLATRDIAAWQAQYDAYHAAKTQKMLRDLERKHVESVREIQERVTRSKKDEVWADRFYQAYDHLDHPSIKPIVSQVYTEHHEELEALRDDPEAAYERLADLTDARIVEVRNVGKESVQTETNNRRRPPRIESSAGATSRPKTEDKPREFSAGSWVAQQRLRMSGRAPKK